MLVSETSASIAPIFGTACGCSLLTIFFWFFVSLDGGRSKIASFHEMTFLGWFSWARILGKHSICQNSPTRVDSSTFEKGERHSKKWRFTPPFFKTFRGSTPLSIIPANFFLKKKYDFRFARRWPCQIDARSPKWDLKGLRTWGISTFPFFLFLTSGGEWCCFPCLVANSGRAKWAWRLRIGLKP